MGRGLCLRRLDLCPLAPNPGDATGSERGLSTILHCLQWYKLVLRTPLQQCSISYTESHRGAGSLCLCLLVGESAATSRDDIDNVQRVIAGSSVQLKCSVQSRGL